ncbi:MAG: hypothetical protein ACI837_001656 [Crocinitomicaceae bacterium]|jgi:hypothetical protein
MGRILKIGGLAIVTMMIVVACSTEKNTVINRNYHSLNAHYNGYFNAKELMTQSMVTYRSSRQENYYQLLPIEPVPSEIEVPGMYPAIDTAIAKCKKVILDHSMPGNDKPAKKKEEHNRWIDENWTTIGIASYYRRDYEGAMKSFLYVRKFYSNDPSLYIGELWMAKTNIATGKLTDAKFNLDNLDQAIEDEEGRGKSKDERTNAKGDLIVKFPKKIRFELEKTKAELAILRDEKGKAIGYLEESLNHARLTEDDEKSRVHFILGQLYEDQGNKDQARKHYTKVIKGSSQYEMSFNARLKRTFLGEGEKVKKELLKMLKDSKNAEFKDQVYYALGDMELRDGNEPEGIVYLTQCAFYSVNNTRQKGMAYERLADMSFDKRNYVQAQKYYDSCALVIDDNYPNAEGIRNKAIKLADLVVAVEMAEFEDSVQRIAAMPEGERTEFLEELIKQKEREEKARKEREAIRLRELQQNENLFIQSGSGSKWYWNNAKTRSEGNLEFKRLWGVRDNENNWRRSDKASVINLDGLDGEPEDSLVVEEKDSLTVEILARNLPLTDSAMIESNIRMLEAYYNAGYIYSTQLNEKKLAETQFMRVLAHDVEDPHNLLSAYEMFLMYKDSDPVVANVHREYIYNNYPNSDYANYLRNPDYFIEKKKRDLIAEDEYVTVLERYNKKLYSPVIIKADQVITGEKDNIFRSKYMLLKAMSIGQRVNEKDTLLPILQMVLDEYPDTPESVRAQEMISIIKNGYSANVEAEFGSKSPYTYADKQELMVIIFPDEGTSSSGAKSRITDFHREFFSRDGLTVDSKVYKEGSIILVKKFKDDSEATKYITAYKRTRKYLLDLQNAKIMMITNDNLKVLFELNDLKEYELFYEEYY